jgi:cytochrome c oxidase accessory protein FixG
LRKGAPRKLGPWRRSCQWTIGLALLAIPFVQVRGQSLLRLELDTLALHAFGQLFRIEELHLLLLLGIVFILFFLLATLVLGRVWCGWACPQTALTDLAEGFAQLIGIDVKSGKLTATPRQRGILHIFYLALGLLLAANLLWYVISPYVFFDRLMEGGLSRSIISFLAGVGGIIYLDLAFIRRLACLEFCPYGRFQTALIDPGTLTLRFHPDEAPRCIRCNACVTACPMGIDIKRGMQIECINCGRCLDACRKVMADRQQAGIIRYTFGLQGRGAKALLNIRMALVLIAFLFASAALASAMINRPAASLKLERTPAASSRMLSEREAVTFFTAYLANRGQQEQTFSLTAHAHDGSSLELRGPVRDIVIAAGTRRRLDFAAVSSPPTHGKPLPVTFVLLDRDGNTVAAADASIIPIKEGP